MALTEVKLGTTVESVEAHVEYLTHRFRLVVPERVLRERFDADTSPENWLAVFRANAIAIERAGITRFKAAGRSLVLLHEVD